MTNESSREVHGAESDRRAALVHDLAVANNCGPDPGPAALDREDHGRPSSDPGVSGRRGEPDRSRSEDESSRTTGERER